MWLFTKHGFFSAVSARQGDGHHGRPVDPDRIMVRARVRSHLEALIGRFPEILSNCEIQDSTGTDYRFRLFASKAEWVQVVAGLAKEIEYDNFKSEVGRHQGREGADYQDALHDVWSVMNRLQR